MRNRAVRFRDSAAWRLTRILVIPVLLFASLAAWAVASPVGSAPDDDFHMASIWCAQGDRAGLCESTADSRTKQVPAALSVPPCFRNDPTITSACAGDLDSAANRELAPTRRGNFDGTYPPVFYAAMSLFVRPDSIAASIVTMRLVNAALFVLLATALFWLLPLSRRSTLVLSMTASFVPLGLFLIPSVNPSGWSIVGCGALWLALLGCFETTGRRRWGLAVVAAVAATMGAGSRGDTGLFVAAAAVLAVFFASGSGRGFRHWPTLLLCAAVFAGGLWSAFGTGMGVGAATSGFHSALSNAMPTATASPAPTPTAIPTPTHPAAAAPAAPGQHSAGIGLLLWNLINVPSLWLGALGTWGLGWFDVTLPWIVPACMSVVFGFLLLWGLRDSSPRKLIALAGGLILLIAFPLVILQKSNVVVGTEVQPRYVLPLLTMFAAVAIHQAGRRIPRLTLTQRVLIAGLVAIANGSALAITVLRYTLGLGTPATGLNPSHGTLWWWTSGVPTPDVIIALGAVFFTLSIGGAMLWAVPGGADQGSSNLDRAETLTSAH